MLPLVAVVLVVVAFIVLVVVLVMEVLVLKGAAKVVGDSGGVNCPSPPRWFDEIP